MINLYIFSNKSRGGLYGVGTYIRELITALRSKSNSIHIHVVHILCDQLQIEKKEVKDVSYWYFPEPISKEWNLLDQEQRKVYSRNIVYLLRNYIQDQKNLVFHLNSYRDKSLALELKIAFDCKVITVTHFSEWSSVIHDNLEKLRIILRKKETNELEDLIQKSFEEERTCYERMDQVISLSNYMQELLYHDYGVDINRIIIIPNGMSDKIKEEVDQKRLRKKWHLYPEEQMIIFVGRLEEIKGTHFLIRAFQLILQESPNCRLWIVGDGDYQNSFSEANPIFSKITFTGFVDQTSLFELYRLADVGVVPSLFEPFGYVPVEMIMHELPIVATATSGLNEVVDESCGLKVPLIVSPDSVDLDSRRITKKIVYLLQNPKEAKRLGKNGRKRYLEKYSSEVFGKNMIAFYKSLFQECK